jgi:predicted RNA-binding protein with PIN domain
VDGMNVIGSRPDRWWEDRGRAMRELVADLECFVEKTGDEVTVVFDGEPGEGRPAPGARSRGRLWVAFAPGGRNAADEAIAERVGRASDPQAMQVVTSDRELAERVRERGAEVASAGSFRRRLDDK